MHYIPVPCVAEAVVEWMVYDVDRSVISETSKEIVELFITANDRVDPTITGLAVVLGSGSTAENKRQYLFLY